MEEPAGVMMFQDGARTRLRAVRGRLKAGSERDGTDSSVSPRLSPSSFSRLSVRA